MKTYVITISRFFPKTHKKAGNPTFFLERINSLVKLHTIRGNYPLWKKRIEEVSNGDAVLSVRYWTGKPYNSKQEEAFLFDKSCGVGVEKLEFFKDKDEVASIKYPLIDNIICPDINKIAERDGLSYEDFKEWFKKYDLSQPMAIIHFTHFRYSI
jgi:hypothetical protein